MRRRAAQGPSNPASQGFGQGPRAGCRWGLQADKSLRAERRRFLLPRPSRGSLAFSGPLDRVTREGTHAVYAKVHGCHVFHVAPRAR